MLFLKLMKHKAQNIKSERNKYIDLSLQKLKNIFPSNNFNLKQEVSRDNRKEIYKIIFENYSIEYIIDDVDDSFSGVSSYQNQNNKLILFNNIKYGVFYLEFQLSFIKSKSPILDDCCLRIFNLRYNEKRLLFRAEWSNNNDNEHAQPHWHFEYDSSNEINPSSNESNKIAKDFNPVKNFEDTDEEDENFYSKMKKFHFAMNANWHETTANCSTNLENADSLARWIENSIKYIKNQLEYSFK
jgi:hypothetical protein